jgi:hypothetical protein
MRPGSSVSAAEFAAGRIGSWMVTSLVPSGNTPSTCRIGTIAATPGSTSSVDRIVEPSDIIAATLLPSRAPSRISSVISAIASG